MKINLWEDGKIPYYNSEYGQTPFLEPFIVDNSKACILVIPGGAYEFVAYDHEGVKVAKEFNKHGISAFVLNYRIAPYSHPVQLTDAKRAIRTVRFLSDKYGYSKDRIGVIGFSAGGHLTSMLETIFDSENGDEIDSITSRPDAAILSYAVIDLIEFGHRKTAINLLGKDASLELLKEYSSQYNVTKDTPPTFIWHTAQDQLVPLKNALAMAESLYEHNVPVELHVYPEGLHGLSVCENMPYVANWFDHVVAFLHKYLDF